MEAVEAAPAHPARHLEGRQGIVHQAVYVLAHVLPLRHAFYNLPSPFTNMIVEALQRMVFQLNQPPSSGVKPPSISPLTQTFGWAASDVYAHSDFAELFMLLYQRLVGSATPTRSAQQPARPTLHQVLEGQLVRSLVYTDATPPSARTEETILLTLQSSTNSIAAGLEAHHPHDTAHATQRHARDIPIEFHKSELVSDLRPCSAVCTTLWKTLPRVLMVDVRRNQFNFHTMLVEEFKNRFEFTEALDLGAFVDPSSAQDNPVTGYTLALVLAYVSVAKGAHHTFVRALPDRDAWTHLSDDASRPCTQREAVEGNFGGAEEGWGEGQRLVHGLVYVRNDQLPPSSCPAKDSLKARAAMVLAAAGEEWAQVGAGAVPEELSELVKASGSSPYLAPEPVPPHILKWWAGTK